MIISSFKGRYSFLSNFYASPITIKDVVYPTVEHFYQSQKAHKKEDRQKILNCRTPGAAKNIGNQIELISVWEECKDMVMEVAVNAKFDQNVNLKTLLIATNTCQLIEGNYHHDNYWGDCQCRNCARIPGQNNLGKLLMKKREELINGKNNISCHKTKGFGLVR